MYTIRTAASRAGVSSETIRAWERRYGVVRPTRTDSGYRLYDEEAIARLVAMRRLIGAGWSAGLAAQEVIERGEAAAQALPADTAAAQTGDRTDGDLADRFVAAAAALDDAALAAVLDEMFARGTFEVVSEQLLFPSLRALGERWAAGDVSVAAEHAASNAMMRRLAAALEAASRPGAAGPRVVVGLPPGGRHELGALIFAVVARRARLAVTYLGADLPVADWVSACEGADAAVIAVVVESDVTPAHRVVEALRSRHGSLLVALGGPMAPRHGEHLWLPDGPVDAVEVLRASLGAR